jgi:hypothetical protein
MSSASTSGVSRAKAFFEPSGLKKEHLISMATKKFALFEKVILPDKSVDLDGVNVVELLQRSLDLALVGLDIDNEDKGVVLFDFLHGALRVKRVDDDLVVVEASLMRDRLAGVLGRPRQLESLGEVECGRGADLASLGGLFKLLSFLFFVLGCFCQQGISYTSSLDHSFGGGASLVAGLGTCKIIC